jgi:hypothetical protein
MQSNVVEYVLVFCAVSSAIFCGIMALKNSGRRGTIDVFRCRSCTKIIGALDTYCKHCGIKIIDADIKT